MVKMYCYDCKENIRIVEGVTAVKDRGYWWCAKHVDIDGWEDGDIIVAFPSRGKLEPKTIMLEK